MSFNYTERSPEKQLVFYAEEIDLTIREQTFGVKYTCYNAAAINQVIRFIQQVIAEAPEKMMDAMTNQPIVIVKIGLGARLIPGMLLACAGFVVPQFRAFYGEIPGLFFCDFAGARRDCWYIDCREDGGTAILFDRW